MAQGFRDDLDRRLAACLQGDARASTTTIANRLGVARSTVHERIKRLEREGVIAGYTAVLNTVPVEDAVQALVMLSINQQQTRRLVRQLEGYPEIKLCFAINGEFDLFLSIEAHKLEDLDALIDEIATIPGVRRSQTSIVLGRKFDRRSLQVGVPRRESGSGAG